MRSEHLKWLAKTTGPYASVYFDDSHDAADSANQLDAKWRDIRAALEHQGAGADLLETLRKAVFNHQPAVGRRGRALIATRDEVLVNEQLINPPPAPVVRLSEYPYVLPLLDQEMQRPTFVFAAVDHTGADVTVYQGPRTSSTTVEGGGYPVHKPATAGWNGYGDKQHTTEEAIRMNCRAIADHLTHLVDQADPAVVFLSGEVRSRADVLAELPKRVAQRVSQLHAGGHRDDVNYAEIYRLTAPEFARRHEAELTDITGRLQAEIGRGSGLAAEGVAAVCAALRDGDVETLIIGEMGDATVVTGAALTAVAPSADVLSDFGEPVARVARADEALPYTAIAVGANLIRADARVTLTEGVAAVLRYAAADRLAVASPE
ncbi:Rv2629 family ribosome hibernation factor [Mycobacterium sp. ML4]